MDYVAGIQPRFPSNSRACFQAGELRSGALLQTETAAQEKGGHNPALYIIKESFHVSTPKIDVGMELLPPA